MMKILARMKRGDNFVVASKLKDADIDPIAKALETNTTLQRLDLYGARISSVDSLAKALEINTTLQVLVLNGTRISSVDSLAKALEINTTLRRLRLFGVRISKADQERIDEPIARNKRIAKTQWLLDLRIAIIRAFAERDGDRGATRALVKLITE
jgi:hypothetical protein